MLFGFVFRVVRVVFLTVRGALSRGVERMPPRRRDRVIVINIKSTESVFCYGARTSGATETCR